MRRATFPTAGEDGKVLWMQRAASREELRAEGNRLQAGLICDMELHPTARLSGVLACGGREVQRAEARARQRQRIELRCKRFAIEPRRAADLEGQGGAAPLGEIRPFQQARSGIEHHRAEVRHRGRGGNPRQPGLREGHIALPAPHWDHRQVGIQAISGVEIARQLAEGHPVADGHRRDADEGFAAGFHQRPCDARAAQRIGAIQHDDRLAGFGDATQHVEERAQVRVEAHAHILHIEEQHVHIREHLRRGFFRRAVEAVDGQSRARVSGVAHGGAIGCRARETVLRAVERHQLHAGSAQHIYGVGEVGHDGGRVGR